MKKTFLQCLFYILLIPPVYMGVYHGIFGIFYISALLEPNCSNLLKLIDTVAASFALETAGFYFLSVPVGLFFNPNSAIGFGWISQGL